MTIASVLTMAAGVKDVAASEPETKPMGPKTRSDIETRYKWDLSAIYDSDAAWETAFKRVESMTAEFALLKGSLGESADALKRGLEKQDELGKLYESVMLYAGLSFHEDMSQSEAQGRWDRVQSLGTNVSAAMSWFTPEILAIDPARLHTWVKEDKDLATYAHAIDNILRSKPHTLSDSEENLLAMAGDVVSAPGNIFGQFTNTELDFPKIKDADGNEVQLSSAGYYKFIYSKDRRVRKDAFFGMHEAYANKQNTIAAMLSSHVKTHIFNAKARKYKSSLEAALGGPNIPVEVYRNLVDTVHANATRLHRYVAMRKRIMNLDEIHRYDLYVPMIEVEEKDIPYDDAVGTILTALQPLGDDYVGVLRRGFESRWIDVYETKNKRSGAYCWGAYTTHPFLLLNYGGTMNDRSTAAHEMGHAMHSWFTTHSQPYVYGDYATFCAEVASTVNEVILAHHLLNEAKTDEERLLLLQQQIEGIRTTVFRQTMFAEFELKIHEMAEAGTPLTADALRKTYNDLVAAYYGPEMVLDDCADAECLRIPHFYRNFYVYTYATSHCAATNIGRRVIEGEPGAVDGLMKFLSAGSSKYPLDVLKLAGVDMTTPKPIEDTMELFSELLDQFEALYEKTHSKRS
ncbi:MAG TPA: oligoendopeptidase F [Phycisphaerae bacterium]|nr:oligoendopeptidase F [Phycisphaerae bacterium]HRW55093.1 oligoendopeptidase F [Phycisphaerae bacterium]